MNLYLIGYRGSGKSTVAPLLAKKLDWQHSDSDHEIQVMTGQNIADIFTNQGESGFRKLETSVVQRYATKKEHVVSLGGGAPTFPAIRNAIKQSGKGVYLLASAETLWQRISGDQATDSLRPSLTELDGLAEVEKMLESRQAIYDACADYTVDTTELNPEQIAEVIANWWGSVDI